MDLFPISLNFSDLSDSKSYIVLVVIFILCYLILKFLNDWYTNKTIIKLMPIVEKNMKSAIEPLSTQIQILNGQLEEMNKDKILFRAYMSQQFNNTVKIIGIEHIEQVVDVMFDYIVESNIRFTIGIIEKNNIEANKEVINKKICGEVTSYVNYIRNNLNELFILDDMSAKDLFVNSKDMYKDIIRLNQSIIFEYKIGKDQIPEYIKREFDSIINNVMQEIKENYNNKLQLNYGKN